MRGVKKLKSDLTFEKEWKRYHVKPKSVITSILPISTHFQLEKTTTFLSLTWRFGSDYFIYFNLNYSQKSVTHHFWKSFGLFHTQVYFRVVEQVFQMFTIFSSIWHHHMIICWKEKSSCAEKRILIVLSMIAWHNVCLPINIFFYITWTRTPTTLNHGHYNTHATENVTRIELVKSYLKVSN